MVGYLRSYMGMGSVAVSVQPLGDGGSDADEGTCIVDKHTTPMLVLLYNTLLLY